MRSSVNTQSKRSNEAASSQVFTARLEKLRALLRGKGTDSGAASRMAVYTYAVRIFGAALAFALQIFLARLMGAHDYGIYSVAWTLVIVLGVMACGGFSTSASRFVPAYRTSGDVEKLRGFLRMSRVFAFGLGAAIAVAGAGFVYLLTPVLAPGYVLPIIIALAALPFFAFGLVQDGVARSYDWSSLAMLPTYIWRPLLLLFLLASAVLAGFHATAVTAAIACVVATAGVAAYQYVRVRLRLGGEIARGPVRTDLKTWVLVSMPMLLVEGFLQLLTSADVIMVSFFESPNEVAVYFAASKTLALVHFVYFAVRAASAHRFSAFMERDDRQGLADYARQATFWTFWPSLAAGAGLLLVAPFLLALFGSGFESGYVLVAVLMVGVLARASVGPADALLTMTGNQKTCAGIYATTFVANVALNLTFIPLLGLVGAALATSLAIMFEAMSLSVASRRKLNMNTFIGSLLFAPRDRQVDP